MSKFASRFSIVMEDVLRYRETLGHSRKVYQQHLLHLDKFLLLSFPNEECLTKEIVLKWMERRTTESANSLKLRASIIRYFGNYINSIGGTAYIFPENFTPPKQAFNPHIFVDAELKNLFSAIDKIEGTASEPLKPYLLPVIFRLIYTCGLRPNEGRELERRRINFDTGEIIITKTKHHKERIVVMSDETLALCKRYDIVRSIMFPDSPYFFPAPGGGTYDSRVLAKEFQKAWSIANPAIRTEQLPSVRIYDLRHQFASAILNQWLDKGQNLYTMLPYLSAYMGHSALSATAYYIHLLPENLLKSSGVDWDRLTRLIPEVDVWPD